MGTLSWHWALVTGRHGQKIGTAAISHCPGHHTGHDNRLPRQPLAKQLVLRILSLPSSDAKAVYLFAIGYPGAGREQKYASRMDLLFPGGRSWQTVDRNGTGRIASI